MATANTDPENNNNKKHHFYPKKALESTLVTFTPRKQRDFRFLSTMTSPPPSPPSPPPPPPPLKFISGAAYMRKDVQRKYAPETWAPVELANYPQSLTRADVLLLFSGFRVAPFTLPKAKRFILPLRMRLFIIGGEKEAKRALREVNGAMVQGRKVRLVKLDALDFEQMEKVAGELKNEVINAARVWHEQYADYVLEVRELVSKNTYYAFLQGRRQITIYSPSKVHEAAQANNTTSWKLIATGMASLEATHGRLEALGQLRSFVEDQGRALETWCEWEGSWTLDRGVGCQEVFELSAESDNGSEDTVVHHPGYETETDFPFFDD